MIRRHTLIGIGLAAVLLSTLPTLGVAAPDPLHPAQTGEELLANPGFEGLSCRPGSVPPECLDNWSNNANFDGSFHDNIFTPQGWITWWRKGGDYGQPEVKTIPNMPPFSGDRPRIRSGYYAVMLFTFNRLQDTGLYQVVNGLTPGTTVQFSAWGHTWSCNAMVGDNGPATSCGDVWTVWMQVGIEPNGVADPFSPSVIWSSNQLAHDNYTLIGPVTAQVGASGSVAVFLRSTAKWAVEHIDAYWDDASLTYVGPVVVPTETPLPPPTIDPFAPTRAPLPTPTPRPDGAIVHVVQPGDTLFGITLKYGVDMEQIRRLNAGSIGPDNLIVVGQELVISAPSVQPTVIPTEASVPAAEATATPAEVSAAGPSICVLAFHDRNGDTFRNDPATEELLPNAEFAVADAGGVIARYTTDGVSEPYCFAVAPGAYRVIQTSPAGYAPSGRAEQGVGLSEGAILSLQFGNVRGEGLENASRPVEEDAAAGEESTATSGSSSIEPLLKTVAKISGALILFLALVLAVLFVVNRRRM